MLLPFKRRRFAINLFYWLGFFLLSDSARAFSLGNIPSRQIRLTYTRQRRCIIKHDNIHRYPSDVFLLPQHHILLRRQILPVSPAVYSASSSFESLDEEPALPSSKTTNSNKTPDINYHWTSQNAAIALPALIGMLVDPLLSLMDTFYTGRVGSLELAALGACTSIFHLAFNAFRATTAATTSLVASALARSDNEDGEEEEEVDTATTAAITTPLDIHHSDPIGPHSVLATEEARQVTGLSLQFGSYAGLLVLVGLLLSGNSALHHMGIPRQSGLYIPAADYLFTRCWVAPVVLWMGVAEGVFRGYGNTIVPLVASLVAAGINLVLDPILMFPPLNLGVKGAAAATAVAQIGAGVVYAYFLIRQRMLPRKSKRGKATTTMTTTTANKVQTSRRGVIKAIMGANLSMITKQGSLLFGWAYATARATRLGASQVAAHQVALSVWLVFALILDGTAVSAQVLMSRAYIHKDQHQVRSLTKYMIKFALLQGVISMLVVDGLDLLVPRLFTSDPAIQSHLHHVMPHLAWQQVIVSLTLVIESLAAGANQFTMLAVGTTLSTIAALFQLSKQTSVDGLWFLGIGTLFVGRLLTCSCAVGRALWLLSKETKKRNKTAEEKSRLHVS
jgi:MATE family multidrug resistance protein